MSLMHKAIEEITREDLQQLVNLAVQESRVFEYKEQLPGASSDERREFLYDLTALANTGGGEMIFGISEERVDGKTSGRPAALVGVETPNPDAVIRTLEDLIRSGVAPRLIGYSIQPVHLQDNTYAYVIRVPRSLNGPHMVTMNGSFRFYTRNASGKHIMDVSELRAAFLSTSNLFERLENWRKERLALIAANNGATKIFDGPKIVLHLIPLSASDPQELLDVTTLQKERTHLWPFFTMSFDDRPNLHGLITFAKWPGAALPHAYVQFFRNGAIESVDMGRQNNSEQLGNERKPVCQ
jgi:predicted HTH transcriptional regulator